jgi:hypothetical protein
MGCAQSAAAKDQSFKAVQELLDVLESESLLATARGVGGLADGDMDAKAGPPDASGPLGHELQLLTARGRDKLVAIRRGLFVFAKTQVHIGYTQGMNEILAALFYVFDNGLSHRAPSGPLEGLKTTAEALSYWAFKEVRTHTAGTAAIGWALGGDSGRSVTHAVHRQELRWSTQRCVRVHSACSECKARRGGAKATRPSPGNCRVQVQLCARPGRAVGGGGSAGGASGADAHDDAAAAGPLPF